MLGGGLLQRRLPVTGNTQLPAVDSCVRWITGCEDDEGGGWNWRRTGCSWKDTMVPDHAGIGK